MPRKKAEGTARLLYENLNGMPSRITGNGKLHKAMEIIEEMEIDMFAFNEHKINFTHKEHRRTGLGKLFHGGETLTRAVGGNFKHPIAQSLGKRMEGGTGIVAYGQLASMMRTDLSGMDSTGLARWSFMTFSGKEGHLTTVLVGYNPCKTPNSHSQSSY
jgi:hypothetical protein